MRLGVFLFVLCLFFSGCSQLYKHDSVLPLKDYPFCDSASATLILANQLRNQGKFPEADSVYASILFNNSNETEREFASLNQLLCKLANNDTLYVDTTVYSHKFKGLASLVKGILLSRKDRSGFEQLHLARQTFRNDGLIHSHYHFLTHEQLGLAHRQKGSRTDSVRYYYTLAYEAIKPLAASMKNRIRLLSRMALLSLAHRDEISGLGYIEEALQLHPDPEEETSLLIYKATLLRKLHRFDESDQVRAQARYNNQLLAKDHITFLLLREQSLMAINRKDSLHFQKSIAQLHQLKKIPSIQSHINRLQGVYFDQTGQMEKALEHYEKAFHGFSYEQVPSTQIMLEALTVLTDGNLMLNRLDKSEYYGYKNLTYTTALHDTPFSFKNTMDPLVQSESYIFISYDFLGQLFLKRYKQDKRQENLTKAFTLYTLIDSLMLAQVRAEEDESSLEFLRVGHGIYSNAIETCFLLHELTSDKRYLQATHRFMERSKSIILYKDILLHDATYFPEVPLTFKQKELTLRKKLSAIKSKNLTNQSAELKEALNELEDYYTEMKDKFPAYYTAHYQQSIQSYDYFNQRSKDLGQSILQYHVTEKNLYCLRYDEPILISVPITAGLNSQLNTYQVLLKTPSIDPKKFKEYKIVAYSLYEELVKPLKKLQRSILLVPDGMLSQLPLEAFLSDSSGNDYKNLSYLFKTHTFQYCYSLKLIKNKKSPTRIENVLTYSFNASYPPHSSLKSLPGSEKEVEILEKKFLSHKVLSRSEGKATKAQFLRDMRHDYDLIHIGLHATSSATNRYANSIYFQNKSNTLDTLFGYEIIPLSINASLVVLTTCESAFGTLHKGEGTFSLSRSFHQAGVKNVVGSLWALPDYSSPLICSPFYEGIKNGISPEEALTKAKQQYLANSSSVTASPFFWASLVCYSQ